MAALGRLASQRRRSSAAQPSLDDAADRRHRKSSVDTYSNPSYEDAEAGDSTGGAPAAAVAQVRSGGPSGTPPTAASAPQQQRGPADARDGGGRKPAAQVFVGNAFAWARSPVHLL